MFVDEADMPVTVRRIINTRYKRKKDGLVLILKAVQNRGSDKFILKAGDDFAERFLQDSPDIHFALDQLCRIGCRKDEISSVHVRDDGNEDYTTYLNLWIPEGETLEALLKKAELLLRERP